MVLVDTSVWIDHLRNDNHRLRELLDGAEVLMHPFILGELADAIAAATTHAQARAIFAGNAARICGFDLEAIGARINALAA
jgi:predicted nucleic acid-binding protein